MTSNTTPSGSVLRFGGFAFDQLGNAYQYFAWASDEVAGFFGPPELGVNQGVGYDFGATTTFTGYYAIPHYGYRGRGPSALQFSGSHDGTNWTVLNTTSINVSSDSNANSWWQGIDYGDGWEWESSRRNEITAAGSYRYVRWMNTGNVATALTKLQLLLS
jgi:hypothetical protein